MMDIFERYFQMLRLFLPRDQRDDIVRELSGEIRAQVADKEAELGRPLSLAEQVAVIRQYGHPIVIAARYRPQRYLIGPVVFPYYCLALKIMVALVFAGYIVASVLALLPGAPPGAIESIVGDMVGTMLRVVGWTTVMAAVMDIWITRSRVLEKWDPAALLSADGVAGHPVHHAKRGIPGSLRALRDGDWSASIGHFVVGVILSAWWLLGLQFPFLFFGPGNVEFGPIVDRLYPVLAIAQITTLAEQFVRLTRPRHTGFHRFARGVWFVSGLALLAILVTSREWQWFAQMGALEREPRLIELINRSISVVMVLAIFGRATAALHRLWRHWTIAPAGSHV